MCAAGGTHFLPFPGKGPFPRVALPGHPRLLRLPLHNLRPQRPQPRPTPGKPLRAARMRTQHAARPMAPLGREAHARARSRPLRAPVRGRSTEGRGERTAPPCHWPRPGHVEAHVSSRRPRAPTSRHAGARRRAAGLGRGRRWQKGRRRRRECLGTGGLCLAGCRAAGGGWGRRAGLRFPLATKAADGKRFREASVPAQAPSAAGPRAQALQADALGGDTGGRRESQRPAFQACLHP